MRVLHVDHTVEPGGAELALKRLVSAAAWTPSILVPRTPDAGVFGDTARPVDVVFRGPAQPAGAARAGWGAALVVGLRIFGAAVSVVSAREFRRADVIHANSTRAAVYAALACRFARKPLVVHVRDTVEPVVMGRIGHALYSRVALPSAARVIANSAATARSAQPFTRVVVDVIPSPSGIRPKDWEIGLDVAETATIGMLARIAPWKGQDLLIRAFATAFRGTSWRLRLAGGTSFDAEAYLLELQALVVELQVAEQVDFVGHVDDVFAEIARYGICVQYSTWAEPLGQNVLQYLASGKPTIAADEGGPREWIADGVNGLLVQPRNVDDLADALSRLAGDPELRSRLADAARATPGLEDDASIAARHEAVFRAAAAPRKGRGTRPSQEPFSSPNHPRKVEHR